MDRWHFFLCFLLLIALYSWHSSSQGPKGVLLARATMSEVPYTLVENTQPLGTINSRIWEENRRWAPSSGLRVIEQKNYPNRESVDSIWRTVSQDINCPTMQWLGNPANGGRRACGIMTFLRHLQCVVYLFGHEDSGIAEDLVQFSLCEVHVFDAQRFSKPESKAQLEHERVIVHESGIDSHQTRNHGRSTGNISNYMAAFKHEWLDVLILDSNDQALHELQEFLGWNPFGQRMKIPASQILVKISIDEHRDLKTIHHTLEAIKADGFGVFHVDPVWSNDARLSAINVSYLRHNKGIIIA